MRSSSPNLTPVILRSGSAPIEMDQFWREFPFKQWKRKEGLSWSGPTHQLLKRAESPAAPLRSSRTFCAASNRNLLVVLNCRCLSNLVLVLSLQELHVRVCSESFPQTEGFQSSQLVHVVLRRSVLQGHVSTAQAAPANTSSLLLSEIIDFLQAEVVPGLKEQLKKLSWEEAQQEEQQEPMYLLADICSPQDFTEVDNSV